MFESHLILRLAIVQNKFQQANTPKINHINNNHIKFEVSLHFLGIWPTVRSPILGSSDIGTGTPENCRVSSDECTVHYFRTYIILP